MNSLLKKFPSNVSAGLLVLRLGVALVFLFSGWFKATNMEMTLMGFASMGFVPFWAYLVTAVEIVGGLAVLCGVYTRLAAIPLSIIMIVAISVVYKDPAMVMTPALMLFATVALLLSGGGKYAFVKEE